MKITSNMLKNFIDIPKNLFEVTNQHIIEVESYDKFVNATKLVVGHVLTCEKHPNADTLSVTTVDIGTEVLNIVCGASNVAKDQYVIVAQVGTVLPGDFEIKKAKIRGADSEGMICSLNELGFDEKFIPDQYKEGIFYFDSPQEVGSEPLSALGLEGDVIELSLTPNRSDLLSAYGFAKDLKAILNQTFKEKNSHYTYQSEKNPIQVKIENEANPLYYAAYLKDIKIKQSPWWLKSVLIANDVKPINNVVDISNYVLFMYGTPLHMFDAKKVKTNSIVTRLAYEGEKTVTLDEQVHTLNQEDIVITNGKEVIAIGGVMGCLNTLIDDDSKDVIIEAAYFDPKHIQKTSRRLGLRSDSSLRFERGVDPNRVILGLHKAIELMVELADAKVLDGISKDQKALPENPEIEVTLEDINQALDIDLNEQTFLDYLKRYEYEVKQHQHKWMIKAPSYRNDVLIDADVIEEIARIYGLNQIKTKLHAVTQKGGLTKRQKRIKSIRHTLAHKGLYEVVSYTLTSLVELETFKNIGDSVHILSPISEDRKYLRQSLTAGLLSSIRYNQSRQQTDVSIYEVGKVFAKDIEKLHLGMALSGKLYQSKWQKLDVKSDYYVLKGLVDDLLVKFNINVAYVKTTQHSFLHPYQQANLVLNNEIVGYIGQIHPKLAQTNDIEPTFVCEIDLDYILSHEHTLEYEIVSKYPSIQRDLSFLIDEQIEVQNVIDIIRQTGRPYLKQVEVFDIYQGLNIEKGKKSVALSMVFNNKEKTLMTDEVDKVMKKIMNRLAFSHQAIIR